jgi:integrase
VQVLSAMWSAAIAKDLAHSQPWKGLTARGKGRQLAPGWMIEEDIERLTKAAVDVHTPIYGSVVAAMILMGAYVGLRPGELSALRYEDLNPAAGMLNVEQQANAKLRRFTAPKGGEPREAVYPQIVQDAVARMPRLHDELLFTTARGGVLWPEARDRVWKPVRAAAGRFTMDLHELRHYCATWLLEQGVSDSDAAEQLGHRDGGVQVRRTYGHPRRRIALGRVAEALSQLDQDALGDERETA